MSKSNPQQDRRPTVLAVMPRLGLITEDEKNTLNELIVLICTHSRIGGIWSGYIRKAMSLTSDSTDEDVKTGYTNMCDVVEHLCCLVKKDWIEPKHIIASHKLYLAFISPLTQTDRVYELLSIVNGMKETLKGLTLPKSLTATNDEEMGTFDEVVMDIKNMQLEADVLKNALHQKALDVIDSVIVTLSK